MSIKTELEIKNKAKKKSWRWVSIKWELPEEFIEKYVDKFNMKNIFRYQKLSDNFIMTHATSQCLNTILQYQNIKQSVFDYLFINVRSDRKKTIRTALIFQWGNLESGYFTDTYDRYIDWDDISRISHYEELIDDDFILTFKKRLNLKIIADGIRCGLSRSDKVIFLLEAKSLL